MEQMSAYFATRREAPTKLPSLAGQAACDAAAMLSTEVQSGCSLPRYLHAAEQRADAAFGSQYLGYKDLLQYRPGEMLRRSASIAAEPVDPLTLPRLLGSSSTTTQAAKGAKCAAAVIAACSSACRREPASDPVEARPAEAAPPTQPRLGSPELPTRGSAGHHLGLCKPCAFVFTVGCQSGVDCRFCHLCEPGEKKRRKKERKEVRRTARGTTRGPTPIGTSVPSGTPPAAGRPAMLGAALRAACSASESSACVTSLDATTAAAEGARRAAAIIAATAAPADAGLGGEAAEGDAGASFACSSRSTADTEDLQQRQDTAREAGEAEEAVGETAPLQKQEQDGDRMPRRAGANEAGGTAAGERVRLPPVVQSFTSSDAAPASEAVTLRLEEAVAAPKLGSASLPTVGSAFHSLGTCKPCAFAFSGRCQSGVDCKFCHLCEPGEKNRRKKERKQLRRMVWF